MLRSLRVAVLHVPVCMSAEGPGLLLSRALPYPLEAVSLSLKPGGGIWTRCTSQGAPGTHCLHQSPSHSGRLRGMWPISLHGDWESQLSPQTVTASALGHLHSPPESFLYVPLSFAELKFYLRTGPYLSYSLLRFSLPAMGKYWNGYSANVCSQVC